VTPGYEDLREGLETFERACGKCHPLERVLAASMLRLPRQGKMPFAIEAEGRLDTDRQEDVAALISSCLTVVCPEK